MHNKFLFLPLLALTLFVGTTSLAQNDLYTKLYNSFIEMPTAMSSSEIKEKAKHGTQLEQQQSVILEKLLMTNNVIVPVGKVEKGKNVFLFYFVVERTEIGSEAVSVHLKAKVLAKKSGEIVGLNAYLLTIQKLPSTIYDGSFKLVGKDFIQFIQDTEEDGKSTTKISQYEFGKELSFDSHIE
ncbi:MAG: hypothetical protein ACI857_002907 [Arenicella sp.]|jgi:hypothetical protein